MPIIQVCTVYKFIIDIDMTYSLCLSTSTKTSFTKITIWCNYFLGLFGWGHMAYEDQLSETTSVPTVKEMTVAAVNYLKVR